MAMELENKNLQISALYRKLNNFLNPIMEFFRTSYICKDQIAKTTSREDKAVLENYYLELKIGEISH